MGHLKDKVYTTQVVIIEVLCYRIDAAPEVLREHFPAVSGNWIRRAQLCIEKHWQHFEQYL